MIAAEAIVSEVEAFIATHAYRSGENGWFCILPDHGRLDTVPWSPRHRHHPTAERSRPRRTGSAEPLRREMPGDAPSSRIIRSEDIPRSISEDVSKK